MMIDKYYQTPRKQLRFYGYDYSLEGVYFVTICTHGRDVLFDNEPVARMVEEQWDKMAEKYPYLVLDEFVVMPNHIHGLLHIVGADPCVGPLNEPDLSSAIQWFKTMSTNAYLRGIKEDGWQPFIGKLWQRGFNDRVVRSEEELNALREYIRLNPENWEKDDYHL